MVAERPIIVMYHRYYYLMGIANEKETSDVQYFVSHDGRLEIRVPLGRRRPLTWFILPST